MLSDSQRYDFDRVFRLAFTAALIVGTVWLLSFLSDVLVPFAVALLLAYLLNPIVNALEAKTGKRGLSVLLTLFAFAVVIGVLVPLLGSLFIREFRDIATVLSDQRVKDEIGSMVTPIAEAVQSPEFQERLREFRETTDEAEVRQFTMGLVREALPRLWSATTLAASFLGSVLNALFAVTGVIIVLLYLVFLLLDFRSLEAGWKGVLPPAYRQSIVEFVFEFSQAMRRYFRGQALVAMCVGILFAIGLKIIGLRMAIVIGLSIGMLNMVPYLQTVGLIPTILLALLKSFETGGNVVWSVLSVLCVFAVVQTIQDALLTPRIMGKSTGLKPWVILLSIFTWGKLLGFLGLILAIPLSCLGLAYYRRFVLKGPESAPAA